MASVIFVAPFFLPATLRFVEAVAALPHVPVGLISQEAPIRLPAEIRRNLTAFHQVRDALEPRQLVDAVRVLAREIGTPRRLLGVLEHLQVPLAEVREHLGISGLGVREAENFRDKSRMKSVLRAAGVPCARHGLAEDVDAALRAAREIGFPLVVKPPAGAGARDTFRVDNEVMLAEALQVGPPRAGRPVLLEEFIIGEEHSFDTVSIRGRHVWHSLTRYYPAPLEVMENPWIQWCVVLPREVDDPVYDPIRSVAVQALDALGMQTGLSHLEWFRRRDGSVAVSEVGARPPGAQFTDLIGHAHDIDFYEAWARLVVFEEFEPPPRRYAAGIAFLRGQGKGRVKAIHGLAEAQREMGPLVVETRLPELGQVQAGSYEGEGFVILRHPETAVVEKALAELVRTIRVEMG